MSGRAYFMDISKLVGLDRSAANRARASLHDSFATLDKKIPNKEILQCLPSVQTPPGAPPSRGLYSPHC